MSKIKSSGELIEGFDALHQDIKNTEDADEIFHSSERQDRLDKIKDLLKKLKIIEKDIQELLKPGDEQEDELRGVLEEIDQAMTKLQDIYDRVLKKITALSQRGWEETKDRHRRTENHESGGDTHINSYGHGGY